MDKKRKRIGNRALQSGLQQVAVGALTGVFAGIVVTLYNILASRAEVFSRGVYAYVRSHPAFIPLLFLALVLGAVIIGGVLKWIPMIRGSGIPQTEGATRGLIHFRWYRVLTGMFATSLLTISLGLSAGAEGPSIQVGGACGCGTNDLLRKNETTLRFQITGGACTGLAVAFNAPLTGMAFAFEEAHKRFTPEVFVCSFSSVIMGVLTRNLLRPLLGLPVTAALTTYTLINPDLSSYLYIFLAATVCGLLGVAFYYLTMTARRGFEKITFFHGMGKMVIPFAAGGVFGLITAYAMGGGHELLSALGGGMEDVERIFDSPLWVTLLAVLVLKLVASVLNIGAGVPCGAFIPMLAVGACAGGLMSIVCVKMGMDPACADILIMICMAAFFTSVVKAPITAIVMVMELTWNFTFLLPVILGVAVGYLTSDIFRTQPLYEKLLEEILEEQRKKNPPRRISFRLRVGKDSPADGRAVRDILWPSDALVVSVLRDGRQLVPDGDTVLRRGDEIVVRGETSKEDSYTETLALTVGELLGKELLTEPE